MYVRDILKVKGGDVISLTPSEPIRAVLSIMAEKKCGAVLVTGEGGAIAGILSERDIVRSMHRHGEAIFDKTVGDLMTKEVVTCSSKDPVAAIMGMMTSGRFRHVPVVDEGQLVGVISIGDVVKSRIEEAEAEAEALRKYIAL
jgi:CBS domain-containing protein